MLKVNRKVNSASLSVGLVATHHFQNQRPSCIVIDVDLLDGNVGERHAEDQCASPPMCGEHRQRSGISDDHQDLRHEDCLRLPMSTES